MVMAGSEPGISNKASLPAKLIAPKVGNVVKRSRLFKLLDVALERQVVWVSAPAGAGKTTLVASYLTEKKTKQIWYQIDLRDADPAAFFAYLRQAVAKLSPRKRERLPLLTPEYAQGLSVFAHNFFEQMFERLPEGTILVFDNVQDLPETSPLVDLLSQAVISLPEGIRTIFISRATAPQAFSRARAARQLGSISPEDLLLTCGEAREVGRCCGLTELSESRLDELNNRAGGWAAGLVLLLEGREGEAKFPEGKIDEHLFDFFAAEVMRRAQPAIQNFLIRSALLPVMDVAATATLTGNPRAEEILRDLVRRNYFITRRTGSAACYEFHPLFRQFLLTELQRNTPQAELGKLQKLAGQLLVQHGDNAAAVELFSSAGAVEDLVGLVLAEAEEMIAEGLYQTLTQWLQAVPAEARTKQPWLAFWYGVSRMPFDLQEARHYFEQSYEAFTCTEDVTGIFLSWAGIAETFSLMWDDFSGMLPWLEEYSRLREKYSHFPSAEVEARVQAALFGVLIFIQPQHPESTTARQTVENLLLVAPDQDFRVKMAASLSLYYSWAGAFTDMCRVVEIGERIIESESISPLSKIMVKMNRGTLCWITGQPGMAHEAIAEALQIAEQSGVHLLDSYLLSQSVYASGIQSDTKSMGETLEIISSKLSQHRRIDIAHYYFHMSWYKNLCRDYKAALEYIRHGMELLVNLSARVPIALGQFGLGKALIQTGEYREAQSVLALGIGFAQDMPSKHLEFTGRLIRAYSWLQQQNQAECVTELKFALRIAAKESEYWAFPLWDPTMVSPLCAVALKNDIEPEYTRELIRKRDLAPPLGMYQEDAWPWPVRVHTLGHFSLIIGSEPVAIVGRAKTKVIEMLKAIIALGGLDVAKQHLCDLLWPDTEGDFAHQNFNVTLHRLRKLLGPKLLTQQDGRLRLDEQRVWLDTWAYERSLAALEQADDDDLVRLACEATERNSGSFLQDDDQQWVRQERERLRTRYRRVMGKVAERLCSLNHWQAAIACYQRALEIEPLSERFYAGLMQCHYQLGQAVEGLLVYKRCREALSSGLDISPSIRIEELHARLRAISD